MGKVKLDRRQRSRRGQTLVEYALILAFVAIITISVLASLGRQINSIFSRVNSGLSSAATSH
jgi:Flp pilus assembly pilin Flp